MAIQTRRRLHRTLLFLCTHSRKEPATVVGFLFVIFIVLCICQKYYIHSHLNHTESFRLRDHVEQVDESGTTYRYRFTNSMGKNFHPEEAACGYLGFPLTDFIPLRSEKELDNFVFVTAASEAFFHGLLNAISSILKFFPSKTIIVYDLGLSLTSLQKISRLQNVEVKVFHYENYPPHVDDLLTYAFKPIIIHEALKVHPGVFWIDTSVRMTSSNMSAIFKQLQTTKGILLFRNTGHSNFAVTHGQMYNYLPTSKDDMKTTEQREANSVLVYRTYEVYNNIIKWWTLCALESKCISPISNIRCDITAWDRYAYCHRFDQSAINILLANYWNFNDRAYVLDSSKEILIVDRTQNYIE